MNRFFILVSLALAISAGSAAGAIIPIGFDSFESPTLDPDTEVDQVPTGWIQNSGSGMDAHHVMFRNDTASDGDQYVEVRTDNGENGWVKLLRFPGLTYEADKQYRVSVDVRLGEVTPTGGRVQLKIETRGREIQASPIFHIGSDIVDSDQWQTIGTDWFTPGVEAVGDDMRFDFQLNNLPEVGSGVQFDNVVFEVVPEPGALMLMATGLTAVYGLRRRRR
jgi:hypothetical protein